MAEIAAKDWLEHHSGRIAQDCAVRLAAASHSVLPSDKNLADLVADQIKADILSFAFHTRKVMERRGQKDVTVSCDPLWPASATKKPQGNLWEVLGKIVHADVIEVCWEKPDLSPNPYTGRVPRFAGSIKVTSDKGSVKFSVGAIVAAFVGSILNSSDEKSQ